MNHKVISARKFWTSTYKFTWAVAQSSSYKHFTKYTHTKDKSVILDIGTGTGEYIKMLAQNNRYIFTDIDEKALKKAEQRAHKHLSQTNWHIKVGDAKEILACREYPDIISLIHVISLIKDPQAFIKLALSSLNKNGELLIYVSQYPSNMQRIYGIFMRLLNFNPLKIDNILSSFNYSKERIGLFNYCYRIRNN